MQKVKNPTEDNNFDTVIIRNMVRGDWNVTQLFNGKKLLRVEGIDITPGDDLFHLPTSDRTICMNRCLMDPKCNAVTYSSHSDPSPNCWGKNTVCMNVVLKDQDSSRDTEFMINP